MPDTPVLDLDFVRGHFPLLAKNDFVYADNAAGTLVPRSVAGRMAAFMTECQVQPNNPYPASELASARLTEAKRLMAEMINASPEEVVFGHSTTNNVYVLSHALRPLMREGDEVIVTNLDHEANNGAWRRLAETGITVKEWRLRPETGDLMIEDLDALLTERTRLVCVTHCSNVTGTVNDIAVIARRVHDAGALICADGVAYGPHGRIDVKALDVDIYLCSLYKIYGPHHALMYVRRDLMLKAKGQNHFFIGEDMIPAKLNVGGHDYEVVASATGIADYFDALHDHHFPGSNLDFHGRLGQVYGLFAAQEERLNAPMIDFLGSRPDIRVLGRLEKSRTTRAPTFCFAVEGRDPAEIAAALGREGIGTTAGHFYAYRIIEALGHLDAGGVVRISLVHYNTEEDARRVAETLDRIL
ncbi:MAG: aminotransferase class V-fold PLP-dependent enzyme [Proteobacteria bacterium]|nr:aminotransferase class V-fold PLP-dependent enzyme [Pseudomonadota bacterium]